VVEGGLDQCGESPPHLGHKYFLYKAKDKAFHEVQWGREMAISRVLRIENPTTGLSP